MIRIKLHVTGQRARHYQFYFAPQPLTSSPNSHTLFLLWPRVKSEVRQKYHGGKNKRLFSRAMHAFYICFTLALCENCPRFCVQLRTCWVIYSWFCFVVPVPISEMGGNDGIPLSNMRSTKCALWRESGRRAQPRHHPEHAFKRD